MGKPKRKLSAYNLYMRKALKGKMTGKTEAQRKAIFKKAARGWNKGKPKSTSRSSKPKSKASAPKSNPAGGTRRMGKSTFNMNKIYGLVRKGAIFLPAVGIAMRTDLTPEWKIRLGIRDYFGYDIVTGIFRWQDVMRGWTPAIAAQVITRVIPAIGKLIRSIV